MAQELKRRSGRAIVNPIGEQGFTLPAASARRGKFLAFDAAGNPVAASGGGGDSGLRTDLASDTGAGLLWFTQSPAFSPGSAGARLKLSITPLDAPYLATGDGATNDRTALLAAHAAAVGRAQSIEYPTGKQYNVGSTLTDISGCMIAVRPGAKVIGNVDLTKLITTDAVLPVQINSAGVVYDYDILPARSFGEKSLWLSEGDMTREIGSRVDCTALVYEQVAWPSGDSWSTSTPSATSVDAWAPNANAGNIWFGAFRRAKAGQTIRAAFDAGTYTRGAILRWSDGYVVFYGSGTGLQVSIKNVGSSVVTASVVLAGLSDHAQWSPDNSEWGIRIYDLSTVGFLLNGYEVYRASIAGIISDIGFAVFASGAPVTPSVSYWSETISTYFAGQQSINVMVYGDSLSAPFAGNWLGHLREAIDYSRHGVRCVGYVNRAVAGTNTANMLTSLLANGVGIANVVVLAGGANDIQGGSPLASSLSNMSTMIDTVIAAGRMPLVVIPGLWLNADQGAQGFATSNAEKGAALRAAFRSLALRKGALIADMQQIEGQILTSYYSGGDISDTRKRDRIHQTALSNRVMAEYLASVILGWWARQVSSSLAATNVPTAWMQNSWSATTEQPRVTIVNGVVELSGVLDAGTKADGTTILKLPPSLRPAFNRRFLAKASTTSGVRLILDNQGNLKAFDLAAGDTYVVLDGVRYAI